MSESRQRIETDARARSVDSRKPVARRSRRDGSTAGVLVVIALGGMLGASARHALELAWPAEPGRVPWNILLVNLSGCLLIGVLMVQVVEVGGAHRLLRPFLGVGVLGGYTTFSTYTVQVRGLWAGDHPAAALGYLLLTPVLALAGVAAGVVLARSLHRGRAALARRKVRR